MIVGLLSTFSKKQELRMNKDKVHAVCDHIILSMEREGLFLNVVKLQRLLYIAYAWHLAFYDGKPLFPDHFEAWKFGPVSRAVHDRFAGRSSFYSPLTIQDRFFANPETISQYLNTEELDHLDNILSIYGEMSAFELEDMLRHEDPWRIARIGLGMDEDSSREIPDEVIYAYYRKVAQL